MGHSIYYYGNLKNANHLGKMKWMKLVFCHLPRTNERLAEISTKLLVEKQQNRSLLSTLTTRPVLEPPCVGSLNNSLVLNRNLTPGENLEISTSSSRPSNKSMEIYLTKVSDIIPFSLGFRFLIMILVFNLVKFWIAYLTYTHEVKAIINCANKETEILWFF